MSKPATTSKPSPIKERVSGDDVLFVLRYPDWAKAGWGSDDVELAWLMAGYSREEILVGEPPEWDKYRFRQALLEERMPHGLPWHMFPFPGVSSLAGLLRSDEKMGHVTYYTDLSGSLGDRRSRDGRRLDVSAWNTKGVTSTSWLFSLARTFNQDISGWDVSSVETMVGMFWSADAFNQPVGGWDVGNVTNMCYMFSGAHNFNQDISGWDVSHVENMSGMFMNATSFNQNISEWNTGSATNMLYMFMGAKNFDCSLASWSISGVTKMLDMFKGSGISKENLSDTFVGWAETARSGGAQKDVNVGERPHQKETLSCAAQQALSYLESGFNWKI